MNLIRSAQVEIYTSIKNGYVPNGTRFLTQLDIFLETHFKDRLGFKDPSHFSLYFKKTYEYVTRMSTKLLQKAHRTDSNMNKMRNVLLSIVVILVSVTSQAQKLQLTDSSYKKWSSVEQGIISNNGKYASYVVQNKPLNSLTRVITSTDHNWKLELAGVQSLSFSDDSKYVFYLTGDTLHQCILGTDKVLNTPGCSEFQLAVHNDNEWLIYRSSDNEKSLVIKELSKGDPRKYTAVDAMILNPTQSSALLSSEDNGKTILRWLDFSSGTINSIYTGSAPYDIIFDSTGYSAAFRTLENGINMLWHYEFGWSDCKKVLNDRSPGLRRSHKVATNKTWSFSNDGKYLFFTQDTIIEQPVVNPKGPLISDYRDAFLIKQFNLKKGDLYSGRNLSTLDLASGSIHQLLSGAEKPVKSLSPAHDVFVFSSPAPDLGTKRLEQVTPYDYYLCLSKTGERYLLSKKAGLDFIFSISPDGNVVVMQTKIGKEFLVFLTKSKTLQSLDAVTAQFGTYSTTRPDISGQPKFIGWEKDSRFFLIQDKFTIWLVDSWNKSKPKNLTGKLDQKNRTVFYPADNAESNIYNQDEDIDILGLDLATKKITINSISIKRNSCKTAITLDTQLGDPQLGCAPYHFSKARDAKVYIFLSGNASNAPNYYVTDFKNTVRISHEFPERKYQWITSELLTYSDADGQQYQAIVYKPENFDSTKRYPVIFQYYLEWSNNLFQYINPEPATAYTNIPLMVTSGYLVVCLDIVFKKDSSAGVSALSSVNAAADFMSSKPWVDASKFGIAGHSLGGYETNYIITHSRRFAAALTGAGVSNLTQTVNDIDPRGGGSRENYTRVVYGYSAGLDSIGLKYFEDSPVVNAKSISTPLLLVHNEDDNAVTVSHSAQFFNQLRTLRKKVWWLQYPGEKHTIVELNNRVDYQERVKNFFDHFLMGKQLATWMDSPNHY